MMVSISYLMILLFEIFKFLQNLCNEIEIIFKSQILLIYDFETQDSSIFTTLNFKFGCNTKYRYSPRFMVELEKSLLLKLIQM